MKDPIDLTKPLPGLIYSVADGIAIITINNMERANSLADGSMAALKAIWGEVRENPEIRVAIVTGAGERHFCTGADIRRLERRATGKAASSNLPLDQAVTWSPYQNKVWKPVICAVNGLCNGAGLHFVADSDIVVAASSVAFMDTHTSVGQVGAIENIGIAKRMPIGSALRMTLEGKYFRMPAARAYALGLVDELVDGPADVLPMALKIAENIKKNSPQALALSKEAIWKSLEVGYGVATEYGWGLLRLHRNHPDCAEGPRAFAEKRDPVWNPDPDARTDQGS